MHAVAQELGETAERCFALAAADESDPEHQYGQLRARLEALGWFELPPDAEFGGLGAPKLTNAILTAAGRALVPGPLIEDLVVTPAVTTLLPSGQGELITRSSPCLFVDIPGDRSQSSAANVPRLEGGRLVGSVASLAHASSVGTLLVVAASSSGRRLVLMPASDRGVALTPFTSMDPCSSIFGITFDCDVDSAQVVPPGPETEELLAAIRSLVRLAISAELLGVSERLLDMTLTYAMQRQQFGRAVGSFQAVKHIAAAMACDVLGMGNLINATTARLPAASTMTTVWCAATKAHASRAAVRTAARALQVHGGIGFTEEYPLQRYYKHALALESRAGLPAELDVLVGRARVEGVLDFD